MKHYILTVLALALFACGIEKLEIKENPNNMLKLYKFTDNQLHYWETWDNNEKSATVHWGIVGQRGEVKNVKSGLFSNFRKTIQQEINQKLKEGYTEIEESKILVVEIERFNKNLS
jgi:predicted DNA-binding WGR domain protein